MFFLRFVFKLNAAPYDSLSTTYIIAVANIIYAISYSGFFTFITITTNGE